MRRAAGLVAAVGLSLAGSLLPALQATPAVAATAPTVTLLGSGYGHGVGMSQYGALGQAQQGATAEQIVEHYYTGAVLTPVDDTAMLKVNLLHQVASATFRTIPLVTGGGAIRVVVGGYGTVTGVAGDVWTATATATGIVVAHTSAGHTTAYPATTAVAVHWAGTRYLDGPATLLDLAGPGEPTSDVNGRYPHGGVELMYVSGRIEAAAVLRLHDEYLDGVAEMPSSWPPAALQAQAIASRTYAMQKAQAGVTTACDCNLYDTSVSQVYAGWAKEGEPGGMGARWVAAVAATAPSGTTGQTLLSGGAPISAFYTSSTGGVTRSSQSVWGGALPYAVSVDDHWSLDLSTNPSAAWSVTVTADQLRRAVFPSLTDLVRFQLTSFNADGTLATATAWSSTGASATATGDQLASALGLRSRWVTSFLTTLAGSPPPAVDVKSVPGHHASGGREWQTWCEPYSTGVQRCWVYIKASTVVSTPSGLAVVYGWVFNNLTYRGTWSPGWDTTPIAMPAADVVINGRHWKITCVPGATGPRTCIGYIWASRTSATPKPGGGYTFRTYSTWVYNDQVVLSAPS